METPNKKPVISEEQAQKEVTAWLDFKKVSEKKRTTLAASVKHLVSAIQEGDMVIDPATFEIEQKLKWPVGDLKTIKYKPRVPVFEISKRLVVVNAKDNQGTTAAYAAALSDGNAGLLAKIDTEDYTLMDHITVFFVV